jgi:hypothetical protein
MLPENGNVLQEAGEAIGYVYFPHCRMISVFAAVPEGACCRPSFVVPRVASKRC